MNRPRLLTELRRRKVFRVVAAYVIVAWALIQIADVVFPRLALPDWTITLVVVLLLMGLPFALALAWAFEITPEGVRREESVPVSVHGRSRKAALFGFGGVVLMALGVAAWYSAGPGPGAAPAWSNGPAALDGGPVPVEGDDEAVYRALFANPDPSSVAVLPFESLSTDTTNAFFTAGIHDAVITALANVGDLTVTSRTSVMPYAGSMKDVRTIAGELGVTHVVEGTVQRAGGRVRVTVQLIDAGTDRHVWADHFEREVTPEAIFAIQSGIAGQVAGALEANLSPGERDQIERRPTDDLEAWELYNRARHIVQNSSYTHEGNARAIEMLRRAVTLDPGFALAYAQLARSYIRQWQQSRDEQWRHAAVAAVDRAIAIDPSLPEAYLARAQYHVAMGDLDGERSATLRALELRPNSADALSRLSRLEADAARLDRSLCLARRAVEVEPTEADGWVRLGAAYRDLGFSAQAEGALRGALDRAPTADYIYRYLIEVTLGQGARDRALEYYRALRAGGDSTAEALRVIGAVEWKLQWVDSAYAHFRRAEAMGAHTGDELEYAAVLLRLGEAERAEEALTGIEAAARDRIEAGAQDFFADLDLMAVHAMRGDTDAAVNAFERAVGRNFRILPWLEPRPERGRGGLPGMDRLGSDDRYRRIVARLSAAQDSMRQIVERNGC